MSQLFASGGQSIGALASTSVLPMNVQHWFSLELTGLISLQCKELSRAFSNSTVQKHQSFGPQLSLMVQLSHAYMTTGKIIALTVRTFAGKMMSLLFYMLSRFVIAFLPRRTPLTVWKENESTVFLQRLVWGLHELIHVQWLGQSWPILNAPWTLAAPVYCFFFFNALYLNILYICIYIFWLCQVLVTVLGIFSLHWSMQDF